MAAGKMGDAVATGVLKSTVIVVVTEKEITALRQYFDGKELRQ